MHRLPFDRPRFHSSNFIPLTQLAILAIAILLLLMVFYMGMQLSALARKPPPSLVQLVDGQVLQVAPAPTDYREPGVVSRVAQEWETLTYNWSGKLPNGKADPGINIGKGKKVTTATWDAAFLLSEDFRREFLQGIAEIVPPEIFECPDRGVCQLQTVLQIDQLLPPKPIGQGQWSVDSIGHLIAFNLSQPIGEPMPINKRIRLKAIPPPRYPLEKGLSPLQQAAYHLRKAGVEIFLIEDIPNAT